MSTDTSTNAETPVTTLNTNLADLGFSSAPETLVQPAVVTTSSEATVVSPETQPAIEQPPQTNNSATPSSASEVPAEQPVATSEATPIPPPAPATTEAKASDNLARAAEGGMRVARLLEKDQKKAGEGSDLLDTLIQTNLDNTKKRQSDEAVAEDMSKLRESIKEKKGETDRAQWQKTRMESKRLVGELNEKTAKMEADSPQSTETAPAKSGEQKEVGGSEAEKLAEACEASKARYISISHKIKELEGGGMGFNDPELVALLKERLAGTIEWVRLAQKRDGLLKLEGEENRLLKEIQTGVRSSSDAGKLERIAARMNQISIEKEFVRNPEALKEARKHLAELKENSGDSQAIAEAEEHLATLETHEARRMGRNLKRPAQPAKKPPLENFAPPQTEASWNGPTIDMTESAPGSFEASFDIPDNPMTLAEQTVREEVAELAKRRDDIEALLRQEIRKGRATNKEYVRELKSERAGIERKLDNASNLSEEQMRAFGEQMLEARKERNRLLFGNDRSLWQKGVEAVTESAPGRAAKWFWNANPLKKAGVGVALLGAVYYGAVIATGAAITGAIALAAGYGQHKREVAAKAPNERRFYERSLV